MVETALQSAIFAGVCVAVSVIGAIVDATRLGGKRVSAIVGIGYVPLFLILSASGSVFPAYLGIVPLFAATVYALVTFGVSAVLVAALFVPLVLAVAMLSTFGIHSFASILVPVLFLYSAASFFVVDVLPQSLRYAFF